MASARQPTIPHMHVPNGLRTFLGSDRTWGRFRRGGAVTGVRHGEWPGRRRVRG